ncbi:hypothetical protein FHG66_08595 [Rubellimicrobium rubrum]|uniref:Uncharacterized protein n=1 Tax=Rubellimicrobium rubrum TaxID=2585369 RepID=A0A5C4MYI8_9RHOB|nr:hypothetical protein [Rubellimicrobium rubrum]TNC50537.1 hypothetical protein FHG66_08595 [Rubellimicrobium rubrum]
MYLHNPTSQAHLEDLRARLRAQISCTHRDAQDPTSPHDVVNRLVGVVHRMDKGLITARDALEIYRSHQISGFSLGRWLVEMVDEGVYLDEIFDEAA